MSSRVVSWGPYISRSQFLVLIVSVKIDVCVSLSPRGGEGGVGAVLVGLGWGGRGRRCGMIIRGCPLIGRMSSCGWRHSLGFGLPFFPLPVLVFLVFFEFASSSGYSSRRDLLPDRLNPSGRPPSKSSQSSRSWGSLVSWACYAMVRVPFWLLPAALPFWASLAF